MSANPEDHSARDSVGPAAICYARGGTFRFRSVLADRAAGQLRVHDGAYLQSGRQHVASSFTRFHCAECHGKAMEGTIDRRWRARGFLSNWSARPLSALVDKIQKTMPFNTPGSLSRQQSADLAAYMLQVGKFPAGQVELSDAMLAQVVFPTARTSPAPAAPVSAGASSLPPPEGNLAELMRAIAFPNSNIIFNLQIKDPGAQKKKDLTSSPFDYSDWGATVYSGWLAVDQAAVAITETSALLLTPDAVHNGRPFPVERAVEALCGGARGCLTAAHRASTFLDSRPFIDISGTERAARTAQWYRDNGATEGSGGTRVMTLKYE